MSPSKNFFDLVKSFEGLRLVAYKDVAGIYTIGYGTIVYPNGNKVKEGDTCTEVEAESYLMYKLDSIQLHENLNQGQYDSCLDFCYNVGQGAWNQSTLRKNIINGNIDDITITENFCIWDKAHIDGELKEVFGLLRRRKCEAFLFINGKNHPTFYLP